MPLNLPEPISGIILRDVKLDKSDLLMEILLNIIRHREIHRSSDIYW